MLYQDFETFRQLLGDDVYKEKTRSENNILSNLQPGIQLRDYQEEAVGRLVFYLNDYSKAEKPTHLLFNMATGSGKTVIMACAILHLYSKGYRNFIFFTRLGHIVDKTKINFLRGAASKYLFSERIVIDGRDVQINQVDSFDGSNPDDINILFSTTAGLHFQLNNPQENSITFEALESEKLVLIADEAHNLSADTNRGASVEEKLLMESWESTVTRLHKSNSENVLLEFTATARLEEEFPQVVEKYRNKAIYKYDLKQYRLDGFSKDVSTLEFDAPIMERVLVALIISQYRLKVAEKHKLRIKPVVLLKANRVNAPTGVTRDLNDDSIVVSSEFKAKFHDFIENLSEDSLENLRRIQEPTIQRALGFFRESGISMAQLRDELQIDFARTRCLTVDDKSDLESKQLLLNTLEEPENQIRAVFATEKLNEGWDVLNLFDIVRLYNTRDASNNRAGKTTVQEAQLIGRGARYYPFKIGDATNVHTRKFDEDSTNELRILEELYYHSKTNPRYIQELRSVLTESGIIAETSLTRVVAVKETFKKKRIWQEGLIFVNSREIDLKLEVNSLESANLSFDTNSEANEVQLETRLASESQLFESDYRSPSSSLVSRQIPLVDFGPHVLRAALASHKWGNFASLRTIFGGLVSLDDFLNSKDYLAGVSVKVRGTAEQLEQLTQEEKFYVAQVVVSTLLSKATTGARDYVGSKTFKPKLISEVFGRDKHIKLDPSRDKERLTPIQQLELDTTEWFAQNEIWGTAEEKALVVFIRDVMAELSERYNEVFLLRNEQHFPIFSFRTGDAFYPDFVLFLGESERHGAHVYQLFIEPKGDQFLDSEKGFSRSQEGWKQEFLEEISENQRLVFDSDKYRLVGLPFFNRGLVNPELKEKFVGSFRANLQI
jgi:type III restriction enzyme